MRNLEIDLTGQSTNWNLFAPLIVLITMIGLCIRYTIATGDFLWLDELHTAWTVSDGLSEVADRATDGNQNPLFFWVTWFGVQIFGPHQIVLRLISVLAGTGLVGVAGWFVWRDSNSALGVLVTGLIIAFDWRFVFYGTEARPYALMQLLGLIQAGLFASLLGLLPGPQSNRLSQSTKWSFFTLLSIALFYCHITSVWLFAAEVLTLFWVHQNATSNYPKPLLLSFAATSFGCLPGALNLIFVFGRRANWADVSSPISVFVDTRECLLFWVAIPLLVNVIGWLATKLLFQCRLFEQANSQRNKLALFVLFWGIVPILGVLSAHCFAVAPLALFRYTLIGTTAMAIFAGLMIGRIPGIALKAIVIAIIAWSSYSNNQITHQLVDRQTLPMLRHEDWEKPVQILNKTDRQLYPQPVLLFANVIEDAHAATDLDPRFQKYLQFPVFKVRRFNSHVGRQVFPCPTRHSPRLTEKLIKEIVRFNGGWLLIRGSNTTVQSVVNEVEQSLLGHLPIDSRKQLRIVERIDDGDVVHLFSIDLR